METHRVEKEYTLSQVRYDLGELCAKGLIQRVPGRHRYRLTRVGLNTYALLTKLRPTFFDPLHILQVSSLRSPT